MKIDRSARLACSMACLLAAGGLVRGAAAGCPGQLDVAVDVAPNQTVTLNPGGGANDPMEEALVVFTNGPDSEPATISVCEVPVNLHPEGLGYVAYERTLTIEVTFQDDDPDNTDTYLARVMIPFTEADVPAGDEFLGPEATELVFFNQSAWVLGVSGNTVNSPGFGESVGNRTTVVGTTPPALFSDDLGDFGVFWHTAELRGFAWANVDHATDFAGGAPMCWSDIDGNGSINVFDLQFILASYGTICDDPAVGCPGDIFFDGVIDVRDLAQLIAFYGEDSCFLPPDAADILHSVVPVDNAAGDDEWGAGAAGYTHLTWDLRAAVQPDDIDDGWTTTEAFAALDDPVYQALTFYQHPLDGALGAPPNAGLCGAFPAIAFDCYYLEATDADPCDLADPSDGAIPFDFVETPVQMQATWFDQNNAPPFDRPQPGDDPFRIARYTILVDRDDADCPPCHLEPALIPSDTPSVDPVLGTIEGLTTHRFGLSNLIPFSFDVIDFCAADIDDNGLVGINDLLDLLAAWPAGFGTAADIDRDGTVGIVDLLRLLARWGPCAP